MRPKGKPLGPAHFFNRELSWLEFNQRVLDEAFDPSNPLLERLKFYCISHSNLDEFFEVRVATLKQQIESGGSERSPDGRTATETFQAVSRRVHRMAALQDMCFLEHLRPALRRHGLQILELGELRPSDHEWIEEYYRTQIRPVLTPLAIDPAHPFPQLLNKSINLIVELDKVERNQPMRHLAVVQLPRVLPRLVRLPRTGSEQAFTLLGKVIGFYLRDLFPGTTIRGHWLFRVTRNSELYIDEEEIANLLKAVEQELHNRRKGEAVRLEIEHTCPYEIRTALLRTLRLGEEDLYLVRGPLAPLGLMSLARGDHSPELRDPPFIAPVAAPLRGQPDLMAAMRERDILLHHPYESFESVVEFLEQAANDPDVLAIKQTLYRTGGDPRIVGALMKAVNQGKQVTAVVELRARFDEANNIDWSRQLEEAGVHVVYGLVGYKIHAKMTLVVRREGTAIRRYMHLGTGNYNPTTARLYTDLGLLTCREDFGEDISNLFNLLTGICQFQGMRKILVAPFNLHQRLLELIQREAEHARQGLPARITARMNSLVEQSVIEALYRASQAGVKIDLLVRGICCLRPGLKGLSENIRVTSVVDRFLEHSRVFCFENACQPEVYVGSADWMPRNFYRRIELVFPIEDGVLRDRLLREIMPISLADNVKARVLLKDGSYMRVPRLPGSPRCRSQARFMELALRAAEPTTIANSTRPAFPKVKLAPRPPRPPARR